MGDIYRSCWIDLMSYLMNYKREKSREYGGDRYCIAMSIDELIEKMKEIEDEKTKSKMDKIIEKMKEKEEE